MAYIKKRIKVFFVRFLKLLFAVSYSMGMTKCDVIPDIFSTGNNVSAVLASISAQALVTCTLLKLI